MMCDACKQNEATVKVIAIINGEKTERHLCADCMEKQKRKARAEGVQSMLSAIITGARQAGLHSELRCPQCGLSFDAFRKSSKLGCAHCYASFQTQLRPLLVRLHGRTQHQGRIPERVDPSLKQNARMEQLRREMEIAVACEDFEQAAVLRDTLKTMKTGAFAGEGRQQDAE